MLPEEPMPVSTLTAGCALLGPEGLPSTGQTGIMYKEKDGKHLKSSIARRRDRMIRELNAHQMIELYGAVLPMAVLLVRDDDDRAFLSETYLQYRALMYKIASDYFESDAQAIEEVMSEAVERLCRYCEQIRAVPCNKRPAYLVRLVENVCRTRLRCLMLEKDHYAFSLDDVQSEPLPAQENVEENVFSHFYAEELLAMLDRLNARDRELIYMRHVDRMSYAERAKALHMKEGTVRTALLRAKQRLKEIDIKEKEACQHEPGDR